MKTRTTTVLCKFALILFLLCLWGMPQPVSAALSIPTDPLTHGPNTVPDYYTTANWANTPPLAKFVDTLPGLGAGKMNNLGQYLSLGKPDIVTYPGSDYYEIDLVEYREQMHSDLPASGTLLRGYVQVNKGTDTSNCGGGLPACSAANNTLTPDAVRYLGPSIVAQRDRPVRIKFTNRLPVGSAGDLFIPVDTTVMGAGEGPLGPTAPLYTQNRATLHLHGGRTPWISDGTPHQWITPAGENTPYPKGVSVQNVPDMPDPGDGSMTFFYSNQQSARLMFYHDHAFGITRLNVYAGEAAGYVITDSHEQDLITRGLLPPFLDQIPLIIQDKTYVDASEIRTYDPLWNWGSGELVDGVRTPVEGDLWLPHVYMPAQNSIAGAGGVNPFGRWMYGPWFYPATAVEKGPVANPYYDPACSSLDPAVAANCTTPGQPTQIPGTPNVSMGMEAFQDSVVVNGTVFPSLTVDPRAYRLRILNAASDRFWNLSFYVADSTPENTSPDPRLTAPDKSNQTEVKMVPASAAIAAANNWPADWPVDGRDGGVPDPGACQTGGVNCPNLGPGFLQFATEGGFLPKPVLRAPQPVTYITDPTAFWVGIVDKTGLALGPAERADTIVDFTNYAGKTLILYNDAPAAWPARVPGYDYFTGAPDMRDGGGYGSDYDPLTGAIIGAHGILPGFAPNTRTVMQVIVRPTVGTDVPYTFDEAALQAEFVPVNQATPSLFAKAQEPIIVGQAAYQDVYPGSTFPISFPWEGISQINDDYLRFVTLAGEQVVVPMHPKGIHDEMGASFDPVYGRMSGNLAMQLPNPTTLNALLILYGFSDLPTETVNNSPQIDVQVGAVIADPFLAGTTTNLADGTQIWKISHNGVDTHPIHFHIFDVQLVNRVGWDGQIAYPEANELGWKDTVKISPLMDTIVAVRPRAPMLPFGIPDSIRPLNPAIALGSPMGFNSVDWTTGQARVPAVTNILYDFKWEYVWHCHILSHEEMDMMRPIVLNVPSALPDAPLLNPVSAGGVLTWTDTTPTPVIDPTLPSNPQNEIGFRIERCSSDCANPVSYETVGKAIANSTTYTDTSAAADSVYNYRVVAYNASGAAASNVEGVIIGNKVKPTIAIAAPNGTTYEFGAPGIQINTDAAATAPKTVAKVDFYINGGFYASDSTAPFRTTITNASVGTLNVTARAIDSTGVASLSSATLPITVTRTLPPAAISVPTGSATGSYTVSWDASATAGVTYVLEESATADFAVTAPVTLTPATVQTRTISGKADSTAFYYRVKAVSASNGSSVWTVGVNPVTVSYPTAAPSSITVPAASGTGSFTVTWGTSTTPGATYTLEESTVSNFGASTVVASGLSGTTRLISGKNNGTFYYRVKAVAAGFSTFPWTAGANGCVVNLLPVVTAPANGATVIQGASTAITATVPALTGLTVNRAEFFDDGVRVGTDSAPPYSIPWVPGFAGNHNLTVIAFYSNNYSVMSDVVTVAASEVVPTITIDAPLNNAAIDLGTPTVITATPADIGVNVFAIGFYENDVLIGYDFTNRALGATYSLNWTPATAGVRTLKAVAHYENFATATSTPQTAVTINGTVVAPASLTVPVSNNTGSYTVSWPASATTGVTYVLEESTTATFDVGTSTLITSRPTPVTALITGKNSNAGAVYYYRVQAVKAPMASSVFTNGANPISIVGLTTPASLTVPVTSTNGSISLLSANTPGATFVFEESKDGGAFVQVYSGLNRNLTLTGRINGIYTYRVKVQLAGRVDSAWKSGANSCTVTLTVATPTSLTVPLTSTNGTVSLLSAISATPGASYVFEESKNAGAFVQVYSGTNRALTLTGRTIGVYTYRVRSTLTGWADSATVAGANSCTVTLTLPQPSSLTVPLTSSNGTISVTSSISTITAVTYIFEESFNGGAFTQVYSGLNRNVTLTGRASGTYTYHVKTRLTGYTDSAWTNGSNSCNVALVLVAPTSLTVPLTSSNGLISILSSNVVTPAGVTYIIEESLNGGAFTQVYSGLNRFTTLTGRTTGLYTYRVKIRLTGWADSGWTPGANGCTVP